MTQFGPRSELLAAAILVTATAVLVAQFLTATPTVVAGADGSTRLGAAGWQFSLRDTVAITLAAAGAGASVTTLLYEDSTPAPTAETNPGDSSVERSTGGSSDELLQARRNEWESVSERLADNEAVVYQTVLDADGVRPQSEVVEQTDLSKATVSRTLDSPEARELVERKRRGMGNVVFLT
ncbi:helix-turn-helix transcriptional regulator [Halomicroarcula sp. GCM10025709]|uniref:helix-turn-helix transcriptional regulator n=1 Tax=Haloarcula TaxID=2237 RepID=UPI0024C32E4B|nr:GntR family transcriptional regulator [Halomicroarcula sp. YJ-61-S]